MLYTKFCTAGKHELHACFYGGLVDTYIIPNIQSVVLYSDKYQSTEENNGLKRKEEFLFSLAHTRKTDHYRKWGCFMYQKGW